MGKINPAPFSSSEWEQIHRCGVTPAPMYYVYIIKDKNKGKLYIGSTNNLKQRIEEHQKRAVFSTKRFSDFTLVYYEAYNMEKEARIREKRLKYFGKAYQELKKRISASLKGAGINPAPMKGAG